MVTEKKARRTPSADERRRAAERSRSVILDAALIEFSEHGFAGARTAAIAARAGVNPQLISYYFSGKQGLYDDLIASWNFRVKDREGILQNSSPSFSDWVGRVLDEPEWARLVIWRALNDAAESDAVESDAVDDKLQSRFDGEVESMRDRQRAGEATDHVDPEFLLLLSYALGFAPIALPEHTRGITRRDPPSPDYRAWIADQFRRLSAPHRADDQRS